jgi:MinD-like ATPase involved in chromosome partitioning or flagellar assembly
MAALKLLGGKAAATQAAATEQAWAEYHAAVAAEIQHFLTQLQAAVLVPAAGSRTIAVIGGKGGSNKTTATAALLHFLSVSVRMLTVGVDFNPNVSTLVGRFVARPEPDVGRLVDLARKVAQVQYPMDLDAFLQPAPGRVHLVHNTGGVDRMAVIGTTRSELDAVLTRLSLLVQLLIIDTGNSHVDQYFSAAIDAADHMVVAALGYTDSLATLEESFKELGARGYHRQLETATVIIGIDKPDIEVAELAPAVARWNRLCGAAFLVPYDAALDGGGVTDWTALAPATLLPMLAACVHAAQVYSRPSLRDVAAGNDPRHGTATWAAHGP